MKKQKVIKITRENRDEVKEYCLKNGKDEYNAAFTVGYYYGIDGTGCVSAHIEPAGFEIVQNVSDLEEKPKYKFKVGDVVKILKDNCGYKKGDKGDVVGFFMHCPVVLVAGRKSTSDLFPNVAFSLNELELFREPKTFPRMMMVGDTSGRLTIKGMVLFVDDNKNASNRVCAVTGTDLRNYNDGARYISNLWKFAEEMPEPREITRNQIKEWAGGEFKIVG